MLKPIVPFDGDRPLSSEYMTADSARELTKNAKKLNSEYAKKETLSVLKTVASNAEQAQNACTVSLPYEHAGVIIARLKELGYWVKVNSDPRGDETYTINW